MPLRVSLTKFPPGELAEKEADLPVSLVQLGLRSATCSRRSHIPTYLSTVCLMRCLSWVKQLDQPFSQHLRTSTSRRSLPSFGQDFLVASSSCSSSSSVAELSCSSSDLRERVVDFLRILPLRSMLL